MRAGWVLRGRSQSGFVVGCSVSSVLLFVCLVLFALLGFGLFLSLYYFCWLVVLFPLPLPTSFEQKIFVPKEGAKVRVLKGIGDKGNQQRVDFWV